MTCRLAVRRSQHMLFSFIRVSHFCLSCLCLLETQIPGMAGAMYSTN